MLCVFATVLFASDASVARSGGVHHAGAEAAAAEQMPPWRLSVKWLLLLNSLFNLKSIPLSRAASLALCPTSSPASACLSIRGCAMSKRAAGKSSTGGGSSRQSSKSTTAARSTTSSQKKAHSSRQVEEEEDDDPMSEVSRPAD